MSTDFDRRLILTWPEFDRAVDRMALMARDWPVRNVYGHPRGGVVLAVALSHALNIPFIPVNEVSIDTLWVDDIYDTGRTWHKHWENATPAQYSVMWFARQGVKRPDQVNFVETIAPRIWIVFPWENKEEAAHKTASLSLLKRPIPGG